ncbi:MAG: hypothetical protein ACRC33_06290, partial [Gemmataceae bacterium]
MSTDQAVRPVPAWRRRLVAVVLVRLSLLAVSAAFFLISRVLLANQLDQVVADLDRSDPGWRWPEPFQTPPGLRPEENSAPHVLAIVRDLPRGGTWQKVRERLRGLPPNAALDAERR